MPVTLLLVVFAPDGDGPEGAAAAAAKRAVAEWDDEAEGLVVRLLEVPRSYARAAADVLGALERTTPDLLLVYDTDVGSEDHKLHQLAANLDDDVRPDADGAVRRDHIIDPEGPVAYRSRLPLDGIWDKYTVEGVPVRMSHKATHVLNHVYYRALRHIHGTGAPTRGGAIETPPVASGPEPAPGARALDRLVDEARMVLAVLARLHPAAAPVREE